MKSTVFIFMLILIQVTAISQPCLPEGITFSTQTEMDSFQINYPNCTEIEGSVTISGSNIKNLNGLDVITAIGGNLLIYGNDSLIDLTGLNNLNSIGGELKIGHVHFPTEAPVMIGNPSLTTLAGLNSLDSIGSSLTIWGNDNLISLSGLDSLNSIGEDLRIGGFYSFGNNALINLEGLGNLVKIGRTFRIGGNDGIINFTGLYSLKSIGLNLYVGGDTYHAHAYYFDGNESLMNFIGLESLTSIGGGILVNNNDNLVSLTGIENLNHIGGNLVVGKIVYTPYGFEFGGNQSLTDCAIKSICDYLSNPNGTIIIEENAPGCNSQEEVQNACDTLSVQDIYFDDKFKVSPNPCTTSTILSYTLDRPKNIRFTIYNVQSQIVFVMQEKQDKGAKKLQWNAEGLPSGMYYFTISDNSGRIGSGKLLKY